MPRRPLQAAPLVPCLALSKGLHPCPPSGPDVNPALIALEQKQVEEEETAAETEAAETEVAGADSWHRHSNSISNPYDNLGFEDGAQGAGAASSSVPHRG